MKIVVCIKQIKIPYARTGVDPKTYFTAEEDWISMVNPYDELAVEESLRVKERLGEGEVILVTLGDLIAEKALRRCLAMGADRLIQINHPSFGRLDPWGSSVVLAKAIDRLKPDLVFCGKEALDENSGQVGAYIAELLGLPYVSCVLRLNYLLHGKKATIQRALGKGDKEVVECELPALFSVDKGPNDPRYPTVSNLLRALNQKIEYWGPESLDLVLDDLKPMTEVAEVFYPKPRPKRVTVPDGSLNGYERTLQLLSVRGGEKKGHIMEGLPEVMASEIIQFLINYGMIGTFSNLE
jgi:electron transfer flavoprotein beta subunit